MANYTRNTLTGSLAPVNSELEKIEQSLLDKFDRKPSTGQNTELTRNLDANSNRIINLAPPSGLNDAVRLKDLDVASGQNFLPTQEGQSGNFLSTDGENAFWRDRGVVPQYVDTFAELSLLAATEGEVYIVKERANAEYIVQPSGYVALEGDVTFTNSLVGQLQADGEYNLKWFGAVADGVTDNNTIMQSAIDRLGEYESLYIPSGRYAYTNLTITTPNITIRGNSRRTTKLIQLSTTANGFTISDISTIIEGVTLKDMWLAVAVGVERVSGSNILAYNFSASVIDNLYVSDPYTGITIVGAARSEITGIWFRREVGRTAPTQYAIQMSHNTTTDLSIVNLKLTRVDGVSSDGYDEFFRINSADWVLFSNCHMNLADDGLVISHESYNLVDIWIESCYFDAANLRNLRVIGAGGGASIFTNLKITDSYFRSAGARAISFENTSQIVLAQILGCTVSDAVGNGIYSALENITNITIANTDFQRCGTGGGGALDIRPLRANILGNTFSNSPNFDIALTRSVSEGSANVKNNNTQGSAGSITISPNYLIIDSTGNIT